MAIETAVRWGDIKIGAKASAAKTISETDVYLFAGIVGNFSPVHVNEDHCKKYGRYGRRVAQGPLIAAFANNAVSQVLHEANLHSLLVNMTAKFKGPTFLGDTITAEAELVEVMPERSRIRIATRCTNQRGEVVMEGEVIERPIRSL